MRIVFYILAFFFCTSAAAQTTVGLGSPRAQDMNYILGRLRVDSLLKLIKYAGSDSCKVLAVNASGDVVLVNKCDGDGSSTNELQTLSISKAGSVVTVSISSGNSVQFNVPDTSITNEIQTLSISHDTLFLTSGGFIKLPVETDPVFLSSAAAGITNTLINNWNDAYTHISNTSNPHNVTLQQATDAGNTADTNIIINRNFGYYPSYIMNIGTSITAATVNTIVDSGYAYKWDSKQGLPYTNFGLSGASIGQALYYVHNNIDTGHSIWLTSEFGVNDSRYYMTTALRNGIYNLFMGVWSSTVADFFLSTYYPAGGTGITRSGSWTTGANFRTLWNGKTTNGAITTTVNDSLSHTFTDTTVVVVLEAGDGTEVTYSNSVDIRLDGAIVKNANLNGYGNGSAYATYQYDGKHISTAFIFRGLSNTSHTITIINRNADTCAVDYIGHWVDNNTGNTKRITNFYVPYNKRNPNWWTDQLNTSVDSFLSTLGRTQINSVNINTTFDAYDATQSADTLHPNNKGSRYWVNAFPDSLYLKAALNINLPYNTNQLEAKFGNDNGTGVTFNKDGKMTVENLEIKRPGTTNVYDTVWVKRNGVLVPVVSDSAFARIDGNHIENKDMTIGNFSTTKAFHIRVNNGTRFTMFPTGHINLGSTLTDGSYDCSADGNFKATVSCTSPIFYVNSTNQSITASSATGDFTFNNGSGAGWQYKFNNGGPQRMEINNSGVAILTFPTYSSGGYKYTVHNSTSNLLEGVSSIPSSDISGISSYQLISKYLVNQSLSGTVNGSNMVFTISTTPVTGTVEIFANGVLQNGGYVISSGTTVTFDWAPPTGYVMTCKYLEQ